MLFPQISPIFINPYNNSGQNKMNNFLLPLGLISYGVYMVATGGVAGHDYMFWIKSAASVFGGLYILVTNNLDKIKSLKLPSLPQTVKNVSSVNIKSLLPTDLENKDNECIVHLRNRLLLANSEEGLETLAKLDGIMFKLPQMNGNNNEKLL
jgi:hypothetical protein